MQSVSDDDVWTGERLVEKPARFELAAKGVFRVQTGKMLAYMLYHIIS